MNYDEPWTRQNVFQDIAAAIDSFWNNLNIGTAHIIHLALYINTQIILLFSWLCYRKGKLMFLNKRKQIVVFAPDRNRLTITCNKNDIFSYAQNYAICLRRLKWSFRQ